MIIKNCVTFTNCISEINNSQTNNAKDIDVVMEMYNLIKYSDTYSKISGNLVHYYRDDLYLDANQAFYDFLLLIIPVCRLDLKQKKQAEQANCNLESLSKFLLRKPLKWH